jgi:hypothetical protein
MINIYARNLDALKLVSTDISELKQNILNIPKDIGTC